MKMVVKLKEIKIGDKLEIQCYKHNGKVHRYWSEAVLLDKKKIIWCLVMIKHKL